MQVKKVEIIRALCKYLRVMTMTIGTIFFFLDHLWIIFYISFCINIVDIKPDKKALKRAFIFYVGVSHNRRSIIKGLPFFHVGLHLANSKSSYPALRRASYT